MVNPIQKQLLDLADTVDLGSCTYYQLAKDLNVSHPYKIQFALQQLIKKGLLIRNNRMQSITKPVEKFQKLINIPLYGEVNCGQPLSFADDTVLDFLKVSPSTLSKTNYDNLFALKAVGQSMDRADGLNQPVRDGDYIISEKAEPGKIKDGDYVISIIDGAANLKRFYIDENNQRLVLVSESSQDIPPIIISSQDADDVSEYLPIAKVVDVIPGVS